MKKLKKIVTRVGLGLLGIVFFGSLFMGLWDMGVYYIAMPSTATVIAEGNSYKRAIPTSDGFIFALSVKFKFLDSEYKSETYGMNVNQTVYDGSVFTVKKGIFGYYKDE